MSLNNEKDTILELCIAAWPYLARDLPAMARLGFGC